MNEEEIWILAEYDDQGLKDIAYELLSEGLNLARQVGGRLCACLLGVKVDGYIVELSRYGVEKTYVAEHELLNEYNLDSYGLILGEMMKEHRPSFFMIGATPSGAEIAPRIAARFRCPCITEVKKISQKKGKLRVTKSSYNDLAYVTFNPLSKGPVILTYTPGDSDINDPDEPHEVEIVKKHVKITSEIMRVKNRRFIKGDPRTIRIEEADAILGVGNGIDSESLPLAQELADMLEMAIGGTRVAVDNETIPYERQIGATGKSIAPRFFLGCGISGASEFMTGIEKAKLTAAINTDRKARIFEFVDLGLIKSVEELIPALIEKLKQRNELR